jgi:hypothetical protein
VYVLVGPVRVRIAHPVHVRFIRISGPLHLLHERMSCVLNVAHGLTELPGKLGQLLGPEQQQRENEDDGGIGRAKHGVAAYFLAGVRVIFFPATKI